MTTAYTVLGPGCQDSRRFYIKKGGKRWIWADREQASMRSEDTAGGGYFEAVRVIRPEVER